MVKEVDCTTQSQTNLTPSISNNESVDDLCGIYSIANLNIIESLVQETEDKTREGAMQGRGIYMFHFEILDNYAIKNEELGFVAVLE